ncbi:hypothetical protein GGR42_000304 [Saonia flava]|uniref:Uncharacterized protein n=1 Tax=Saonia flava TaxID=523696 RepID=A0A846QTK4_9FLAO|nr:hypothetical protein [Saonia flava]NJB69842.1 hypothetical protein [Saonia flava]
MDKNDLSAKAHSVIVKKLAFPNKNKGGMPKDTPKFLTLNTIDFDKLGIAQFLSKFRYFVIQNKLA